MLQTQAVKKKNEYSKAKDKDLVTNIAHTPTPTEDLLFRFIKNCIP